MDCYVARSAALIASSKAVSLNGLNKHSTAPCSRSCGRTVPFPFAVMKTIGIRCWRSFNSRRRSGPVIPGIKTSRIRQRVWLTQSELRNSSADEKARAKKPNSLTKSGRDSRTDSSSSTTDTRGRFTRPFFFWGSITKQCANSYNGVHCTLVLASSSHQHQPGIMPQLCPDQPHRHEFRCPPSSLICRG